MIAATQGTVDPATVIARLADLGPASEIRNQGPALAAEALQFDRVLLTSIVNGQLVAESLYVRTGDPARILQELRAQPVPLEYPIIEGEILRRRRPQVVRLAADDAAVRHAFAQVLGWTAYVAAPILLDGRVIGFFHADRTGDQPSVDDADGALLASFATCFALVYERAVLRHRLRIQRQEMRHVASWADARTSELGDRSVTLSHDASPSEGAPMVEPSGRADQALRDLLTRRELEVLQLMVQGETNAGIARDLVVAEGTVKFHVKNILRKLHASNRAEATSRYLRLTLNNGRPSG